MKFIRFNNYKLFNGSLNYLAERIESSCKFKKNNPKIINFINPHSYIVSLKDYIFHKSILNSNLILIDGFGVYIYLKLFRRFNYVNRITGYDFFEAIIKKNLKFFFLGGDFQTSQRINEKLINNGVKVECFSPSFSDIFSEQENKNIVKKINKFKPNILFVGMTAPKQEKWSYQNRHKLHCNYIINIGAVFDYFSGKYFRPPKIIREIGLEWLFRLIQSPKIWRRTFVSGFIYVLHLFFLKKKKNIFFDIIDKQKKINEIINKKKTFVLTAFNLNFFSNIYCNNLKLRKYSLLWSDGLFSKFINKKFIKIPGFKLITDIRLSSKFKSIHVIGNIDSKVYIFLKKKFNRRIINFTELPFGDVKKLRRNIPKIKRNSLILLTIPTPKQEIVADAIIKKNSFGKIICIGGGIKIASGSEKKCPNFFYKLGLEFLWRLNTDTKRRVRRLLLSLFYFFKSFVTADIIFYSYKNEK
jgi:N-acetylglucosaminyldiphosphoundecaprenol N-acetyl-beta-D-mannosaminyltransferase